MASGSKIVASAIILLIILSIGIGLIVYLVNDDGTNTSQSLQFIPEPDEGSLIWFKQADHAGAQIWASKIDSFIDSYLAPPPGEKTQCHSDYIKVNQDKSVPCAIDVAGHSRCSAYYGRYGYTHGSPCIILKLKKTLDWIPDPYTGSPDSQLALENGMPKSLVEYIQFLHQDNWSYSHRRVGTTWITCEGQDPSDKENIGTLGYYFPGYDVGPWNQTDEQGGIPNYFFPYLNQDGYVEPFIFVKFYKPAFNVIINVKCKAWAKNLDAEEGQVNFELMVD